MKWSWRIATLAGIGVYVHATFLLILLWVAYVSFQREGTGTAVLRGIVYLFTVFGIVVLHELGHALAARRFNIQTRDITLYPIGGVARLERMPEKPWQEFIVAIAGPAVNGVLALVAVVIIAFAYGSGALHSDPGDPFWFVPSDFLLFVLSVNVFLALFNLLPAFPMDGGRVLRALLALKLDYVQATQIAATVGQAMALLFGVVGLFTSEFILMFIAVFVWMGAAAESSMVQIKGALGGIPVVRAMIREFHILTPTTPLSRAVDHILAGFQHDFPVTENGRLVGVLTRSDLLAALSRQGNDGLVGEAMQRNFQTATPYEMLDSVLVRLQSCDCRSFPVVQGGEVVGMITTDNVGEFMMVQSALHDMPTPRIPQ
ncbi:MAG: site-2 protease family protein [FCB group bacterium]|jgi:Zn-dependent protease|nr:site-2 protease family protein [FCB group bacterium]